MPLISLSPGWVLDATVKPPGSSNAISTSKGQKKVYFVRVSRIAQVVRFYKLGELLAALLPVGLNFVPVYQLRETTGSCQWLLTDSSFLTHRSSGSSPLQPTTWSCTRIGCCQGNRETSFWVTGCQIASALSSSRAIPSSFPQVSKMGGKWVV